MELELLKEIDFDKFKNKVIKNGLFNKLLTNENVQDLRYILKSNDKKV
jgi:hypothetical protein